MSNPWQDEELFKLKVKNAREYANMSIKKGYSSPEDWEGLTDEELVAKAQHDGDQGDVFINAAIKGEND